MLPPGPSTPAFIQMIQWLRSPAAYLEKLGARWGEAFTTSTPLFGTAANVTHPDALKQIFNGDPSVFHAGELNQALAVFVGRQSVLLLDDEAHLHVRRLMLPAFHGDRMRRYTAAMRDATRRAMDELRPGQRLSLRPFFQRVTLEVILRAVIGQGDGPELEEVRAQVVRLLTRAMSPSGMLWTIPAFQRDLGPLTPWAALKRETEAMDRLLFNQIDAHRRSKGSADDVLSMLVEAVDEDGQALSDVALRDQLVTLIVAGHETSATSLCWAFEEILRAPDEQERLIAEAEAALGGAPVEAEHLPKLERLDSVIKETLRLHPASGAMGRKLKEPATVGGYDLPAGVLAIAAVHLTHRRPDLYPEPERFISDRFIGKKIDPYAWAPFGGGIRRCLGMAFALHEMKVILATIFGAGLRLELAKKGPYETALRTVVYSPKGETPVIVRGVGPLGRA
jgi:cytochrome P450 family 110